MDIVYRMGRATAAEVQEAMPEGPGYSATRALLRILEEKGHLRHEQEGLKYVFLPTVARSKARRSALKRVVETFFGGSPELAMAALLDMSDTKLPPEEFERLAKLIKDAQKEGR